MGEWSVILSNSPFVLISNDFSRLDAVDCEYPNTPNVREFSLVVRLLSPNLSVLLTVKFLTLAPNNPLLPTTFALTSVVKLSYPIPELITTVSTIKPSLITGLTIAPVPDPVDVTSSSGNELYWLPWLVTITSSIRPLLIIGFSSASLPFCMVISGLIWWFNIVEP